MRSCRSLGVLLVFFEPVETPPYTEMKNADATGITGRGGVAKDAMVYVESMVWASGEGGQNELAQAR